MDDDLSALILGVGLRVLAHLAHFNLKITAFMIGVWEGFALYQTTAYKPNSLYAYAMQALRFAFDYYFFGKNCLLLGMMTLYLLVTWTVTNALVESSIHERSSHPRESHPRRRGTRPPRYTPLQPAVEPSLPPRERVVQFQHIPPLPTRPRVYEDDHHARGAETGNIEQVLTPEHQPTVPLDDDDHISIHEVAPSDSEQYSSFSSVPPSINDASELPLPVFPSEESEPIDDVPSQNLALISDGAKNPDKPEYVDPSSPDVGPVNVMPTPPLTPSGDDDVLSIQIPLLDLGSNPESVIVSESVQAMEEEVGEVVAAVYRANLAAQPDVASQMSTIDVSKSLDQADAVEVKPTTLNDSQSAADTVSALAEIESIVSTTNPQSLQKTAENYRNQAQAEVQKRDQLLQERLKALAKTQVREAFLLALKARRSQENVVSLHRKAERRYFLAHNRGRPANTLDLHGLRVPEAIYRTREAIRDIVLSGGGQDLIVIVGRGNHSPGSKPVLKPAVRQAMEKSGLKPSFDRNPGVLKIAIPVRTSTPVAPVVL